jgi:hypothetical protein
MFRRGAILMPGRQSDPSFRLRGHAAACIIRSGSIAMSCHIKGISVPRDAAGEPAMETCILTNEREAGDELATKLPSQGAPKRIVGRGASAEARYSRVDFTESG